MLFKLSTVVSVAAMLMASGVTAAPSQDLSARSPQVPEAEVPEPNRFIALNPGVACSCPNNCGHHEGSSCRYYGDFSDSGPVRKGRCGFKDNKPWCWA